MQIEGFADDPNAKGHDKGRVRAQRVWTYEDDYKEFGITEDCKKCQHNQRWGYNKSRKIHSERCRTRMETSLATTESGQKRLDAAEERMNQRLAKAVEEADVRPERGIEAVGPDVGFENQHQRLEEPVPGMEPAERRSTQRGANGRRLEKAQGPSGLNWGEQF